jgi:hypothetical protein
MYTTPEALRRNLNESTGNKSWGELKWQLVEPGKLARTQTELGSYSIEIPPDGKTYQLSFDNGSSGVRVCPTKFQAINVVQGEANDHHKRLLAQRQRPIRMKPPKW